MNDVYTIYTRYWPAQTLDDLAIPNRAKFYLSQNGLPWTPNQGFRFIVDTESVPRIADAPELRVLGIEYMAIVCLDESRSGAVVQVDADGRMFMNSNVELLGHFLSAWYELAASIGVAQQGVREAIARFAEQMCKADPEAMEDRGSYWRLRVEMARDGL